MTNHGLWMAVALLLAPDVALAGAWTLSERTGQAFVTATATRADQVFGGSLTSSPRYNKLELQGWFEYGLTSRLTVIAAPGLQHVDIAAPVNATHNGLGYSELGGRYELLKGDSWVLSGQATVRVPGTADSLNPATIGYTRVETDVRGLLGYSFSMGNMPAFIDLQLAQRMRMGSAPDELRFDATLGVLVAPKWLLLAQSFNVFSEGAGSSPFTSYEYYKFQLSAVYTLTPSLSLQLGGISTYAGRNALQENGVILGAWYRF